MTELEEEMVKDAQRELWKVPMYDLEGQRVVLRRLIRDHVKMQMEMLESLLKLKERPEKE